MMNNFQVDLTNVSAEIEALVMLVVSAIQRQLVRPAKDDKLKHKLCKNCETVIVTCICIIHYTIYSIHHHIKLNFHI